MSEPLFDRTLVGEILDEIVANVADPDVRAKAIQMRAFMLHLVDTTEYVADALDIYSVRADLLEERNIA